MSHKTLRNFFVAAPMIYAATTRLAAENATPAQIVKLMRYAEENRNAYDRGVSEERARIARDIHDNIGAQLMQALHSEEGTRKDAMIRNTLADLREIINNSQGAELPLEALLADLRAEAGERLEQHGIALDWEDAVPDGMTLAKPEVHSLRSAIREATSNVIKHSGAGRMRVAVALEAGAIALEIADDGRGVPEDLAEQLPRIERLLAWLHHARQVLESPDLDRLFGELNKLHELANLPLGDDVLEARVHQAMAVFQSRGWKHLLRK